MRGLGVEKLCRSQSRKGAGIPKLAPVKDACAPRCRADCSEPMRHGGGRFDDPRHDHGEDQLGPAPRSLRQRLVEPEPAHRPDVAMRQRAGDLEGFGSQRHEGLAGEHPAQAI